MLDIGLCFVLKFHFYTLKTTEKRFKAALEAEQIRGNILWAHTCTGNFSSDLSGAALITAKVFKTRFPLVPPTSSPFVPPSQKLCDVQQRADGRRSLHGGSDGEDSATAGTQGKKLTHFQQNKQSHSPEDNLPSAAAATGLRAPLCAALASTRLSETLLHYLCK